MDNIHKGHRARMREKLLRVGEEAFHTYELLEMMLYYVVPYKDTNPISQRLFMRFGSLEGIFSASEKELSEVEGVGKATARYITELSEFCKSLIIEEREDGGSFTKDMLSEYAVELIAKANEPSVFVLFFDGKMRLLGKECILASDLGSAAVKPSELVKKAVLCNAVGAVTVHSHPYGPLFMSEGDRLSGSLIGEAFSEVGVTLLLHVIVSGSKSSLFEV